LIAKDRSLVMSIIRTLEAMEADERDTIAELRAPRGKALTHKEATPRDARR
jgi:hypothetical protein